MGVQDYRNVSQDAFTTGIPAAVISRRQPFIFSVLQMSEKASHCQQPLMSCTNAARTASFLAPSFECPLVFTVDAAEMALGILHTNIYPYHFAFLLS